MFAESVVLRLLTISFIKFFVRYSLEIIIDLSCIFGKKSIRPRVARKLS